MYTTVSPPTDTVLDTIGNTPCVRLKHIVREGYANIFLKLEYFNPTGPYKDRMAKSMIEAAEKRGGLKAGMTVVEASGRKYRGLKGLVVSSNAFALEKLQTMRAFGTKVDIIQSPSGKIRADLIPSMTRRVAEHTKDPQIYWTDQFNNRDAVVGYQVLGSELTSQFPNGIDAFCGAVGTAGMVMGVADVLKSRWPECRVAILEPASSPCISEGRTGTHHIEGIGIGIIPPLLSKNLVMCRRLAKEEGLLVGTSTGLNVAGALRLAKELGSGKTVITVACDTELRYMNCDLFT
ncbi:tryptophan synthase beta subunit-like PLP-dependent enzyme [Dactylonectria macrodidyma]|uniref:Tryptophan synthase beta subunit-like PLP-dependent enzyme n=1 Tax=Dactylonectria macrodidyma TaxID=307937 RepID=A0A9P9E1H8_9HYPO|nr:tryptophan synthase beta subunit-like PLP-dependent enzyme [Dactylonectria macrodidyma]